MRTVVVVVLPLLQLLGEDVGVVDDLAWERPARQAVRSLIEEDMLYRVMFATRFFVIELVYGPRDVDEHLEIELVRVVDQRSKRSSVLTRRRDMGLHRSDLHRSDGPAQASPQFTFEGAVRALGLVERIELGHVLVG